MKKNKNQTKYFVSLHPQQTYSNIYIYIEREKRGVEYCLSSTILLGYRGTSISPDSTPRQYVSFWSSFVPPSLLQLQLQQKSGNSCQPSQQHHAGTAVHHKTSRQRHIPSSNLFAHYLSSLSRQPHKHKHMPHTH